MHNRSEMTILEHLLELRKSLFRISLAIIAGSITAFLLKNQILDLLLSVSQPEFITNRLLYQLADLINSPQICINQQNLQFINIELAGQFMLHITISLVAGIIFAMPYSVKEILKFVKPALNSSEQNATIRTMLLAALLMTIGLAFGYFVMAPVTVQFLSTYEVSKQIVNQITIQSFISYVTKVILSMGVGFELPLIVWKLSKWKVINAKTLKRNRPIVIVVLLTISALLTPPDVFTMLLLMLPLWAMYEVSVMFAIKAHMD